MSFHFNACAKVAFAAAAALFLTFESAQAGLIGSTIDAQFVTREGHADPIIRGEETFTVTDKLGLVDLGEGIHLTFSDTQITLSLNTSGAPFILSGNSLFAVLLTLLDGPDFIDLTIDPSSTPELADGARLLFVGDGAALDISQSCGTPGCPNHSKLVVNVATDVPEPATIAMLGAGMAGFAALRRRRKL